MKNGQKKPRLTGDQYLLCIYYVRLPKPDLQMCSVSQCERIIRILTTWQSVWNLDNFERTTAARRNFAPLSYWMSWPGDVLGRQNAERWTTLNYLVVMEWWYEPGVWHLAALTLSFVIKLSHLMPRCYWNKRNDTNVTFSGASKSLWTPAICSLRGIFS